MLKIGWGIGYVDRMAKQRVALCVAAGVTVCLGGTLLEISAIQGRVTELRRWAADIGVEAIEVSNGLQAFDSAAKTALVRSLSAEFVVLAETGAKDGNVPVVAEQWLAEMEADLEAGARWVIAEGRESERLVLRRGRPRARQPRRGDRGPGSGGPGYLRGAAQAAAGVVHPPLRGVGEPRQRPA